MSESQSMDSILAELRLQQQRLDLALTSGNIGLWDWDLVANEVFYSDTAKTQLGYPASTQWQRTEDFKSLIHDEDREETLAKLRDYLENGEGEYQVTYRARKADGGYCWILSQGKAHRDQSGKVTRMLGVHVDVTAQHQAEEFFRATVESAPMAIVVANAEGKIVTVNSETESLFGYPRGELIGQPVETLVPKRYRDRHPSQREQYHRDPQQRRMGAGRDLFGLRKDGSEFPIEIGLSPIQTHEGLLVLSAIADISERKRAEEQIQNYATRLEQINQDLEWSNEELERSNRELDRFAYSASHDLKSPLRGVANLATFVLEDTKGILPKESVEDLEMMQQRIRRMEKLLDDLLEYSRVGRKDGEIENVDLNELIQDVIDMQERTSEFRIEFDSLPTIKTQRAPLEQVFRNLIGNAIKHHDRKDGCVTVRAEDGEGSWVEFVVSDDGPGIPEKYQETVFEMFETLRPRDEVEGSGMGLALVRKIVESKGGEVTLQSDGRGCEFRFRWPKQ